MGRVRSIFRQQVSVSKKKKDLQSLVLTTGAEFKFMLSMYDDIEEILVTDAGGA